jgi:hypothetical protein
VQGLHLQRVPEEITHISPHLAGHRQSASRRGDALFFIHGTRASPRHFFHRTLAGIILPRKLEETMASKNKPLYPSSFEYDRIVNLEYHKSQMRKCHDCGELTTDYRCTACRTKWRIKNGVSPTMSDSEE